MGVNRFKSLICCVICATLFVLVDARGDVVSANESAVKPSSTSRAASTILTDTQVIQLISGDAGKLSRDEARQIWIDWKSSQKPAISRENLYDFLSAQRMARIGLEYYADCRLYGDDTSHPGDADKLVEHIRQHYAEYQDDLLLDVNYLMSRTSSLSRRVVAYDGKVERQLDVAGSDLLGTVGPFSNRGAYAYLRSPLELTMLSRAGYRIGDEDCDIVEMLKPDNRYGGRYLLETCQAVDGEPCQVVAQGDPPLWKAYLDPKLNYAVRKVEFFKLSFSALGFGRVLEATTHCSDFEACGSHYFFPKKIEWTRSEVSGAPAAKLVENVESVTIGQPISQAVFTRVFPSGTFVRDMVRNVEFSLSSDLDQSATEMDDVGLTQTSADLNTIDGQIARETSAIARRAPLASTTGSDFPSFLIAVGICIVVTLAVGISWYFTRKHSA